MFNRSAQVKISPYEFENCAMKPERADKRAGGRAGGAGGVERELSKISIVTSEYLANFLETVD